MKLVTFEKDGHSAIGLLNAAGTAVHPVPCCADMQALIGIWPVLDTAAVLRGAALPLESVRLVAATPPRAHSCRYEPAAVNMGRADCACSGARCARLTGERM